MNYINATFNLTNYSDSLSDGTGIEIVANLGAPNTGYIDSRAKIDNQTTKYLTNIHNGDILVIRSIDHYQPSRLKTSGTVQATFDELSHLKNIIVHSFSTLNILRIALLYATRPQIRTTHPHDVVYNLISSGELNLKAILPNHLDPQHSEVRNLLRAISQTYPQYALTDNLANPLDTQTLEFGDTAQMAFSPEAFVYLIQFDS